MIYQHHSTEPALYDMSWRCRHSPEALASFRQPLTYHMIVFLCHPKDTFREMDNMGHLRIMGCTNPSATGHFFKDL